MPQVSQDLFAKLYPFGLLIGLLFTNLRASTVLQRAGAVQWTAIHSLLLKHRSGVPEQYLVTHITNGGVSCVGSDFSQTAIRRVHTRGMMMY